MLLWSHSSCCFSLLVTPLSDECENASPCSVLLEVLYMQTLNTSAVFMVSNWPNVRVKNAYLRSVVSEAIYMQPFNTSAAIMITLFCVVFTVGRVFFLYMWTT